MDEINVSGTAVQKAFRNGTHRQVPPDETLARVHRLLPVMGITRIANVTGLDSIGIPVVMVCRPNARGLSVSQGKGLDLAAAKASGVMESIEIYHGEHITLPLKLASYEDLRYSHRLVDVSRLPRARASRFHPSLPILWIEGYDLLLGEQTWVPYESVYTRFTVPAMTGAGCFPANSSGLASGNHRLEALSHAICEVVERDAITLFHLLDPEVLGRLRIDPDAVDDPACREMLERYDRAAVDVALWDATPDAGIPTFECLIMERDEHPFRLLYYSSGSGCHPSRGIALLRALTEAAQSRLTYIAGSRDDMMRENYERLRNPEMLRYVRGLMEVRGHLRDFRTVPSWEGDTLNDDVAWELERLRSIGIDQVVVVDLTKAEFQVPVVRVMIPGLEGKDQARHFVPGPRARARAEGRL
jgi:YcaO-like protein with predicted kinase domain